jgi:hypothetical protein
VLRGILSLSILLTCCAAAYAEGGAIVERVATAKRIKGRITEAGTRTPIAHATLVATDPAGNTLAEAESGDDGAFALLLPRGPLALQLTLAASGHKIARQKERLNAGEVLTVDYALKRASYALYESTVRGAPPREEIARTSLDRDEVLRIPGTRGDALRAALNLPSVARATFDLGLLILRGSAPGDSGAFINGMSIPQTFHFGGLTSTFNSYLLERFDLVPSNFSARYGRLTGGVVDIQPREGKRDRFHGELKLDLYDAHAIIEGPLGKKDPRTGQRPGSFAIAFRRSYIDAILGAVLPSGTLTVSPRYYDYEALLDYKLGPGRLHLLVFGSDDELRLVLKTSPDNDSSLQGQLGTRLWFHTLQARYVLKKGPLELEMVIAPGIVHQDGTVGTAARFLLDQINLDARLETRLKATRWLSLVAGLDLQQSWSTTSVQAPKSAAEAQPQGPLGVGARLSLDSKTFNPNPAIYLEGTLRFGRVWLVPGLRLDWLAGVHGTYPQPRLMTRVELAPRTFLKAGIGLYAQSASAPYNTPGLGNPAIRAQQAVHATVGVETRPFAKAPGLEIQLNVFAKYLWGIAVDSEGLVQRDGRVAAELYGDGGIGRVYGGDLLIKHTSSRYVYGWIAYTLSRSERRDAPTLAWRRFQFDQTHVLTLVAGYHLPWEIDVGIRLRYASGNPEIVQGPGVYDADHDVTIPSVVGQPYSTRLPDFFALDLRIDKRFAFKKWILALYLDIQNLTNYKNVEGYQYSYDYTRRSPVTGLPILPSIGLRASF